MTSKTLFARIGLGGIVLAAAMTVTPAVAAADPITDFLCSTGSAQFCPPPPPPPPALFIAPPPPAFVPPAPQAYVPPAPAPSTFQYQNCTEARDAGAAPVYPTSTATARTSTATTTASAANNPRLGPFFLGPSKAFTGHSQALRR